jgi:cytochrome c-type biogenesis protein CcmH/NrfG
LGPYTRALPRARAPYVIAAGLIVAFAAAAALMHAAVSSRRMSGSPPPAAVPAADGATPAAPSAQSMQAAIAGLEARLARGGGSDADWELLAKAYEFVGRTDDARRARSHIVSASPDLATLMAAAEAAGAAPGPATAPSPAAARSVAPSSPSMSLEELRRHVQTHPDDAPSWLALAELYRERHDDPAARDALARVVALHGMTAQSWADYADVLASLAGGSLSGPAGSAIDQALALDPANPKALWLKASQAHEQHHFGDALTWWHKLRAVLPADSPDLRVIDANIAEDTQLGGPGQSGTARASN